MATRTKNVSNNRQTMSEKSQFQEDALKPVDDFVGYLREYATKNPEHMALWCLGIGFVLGWKLKPW